MNKKAETIRDRRISRDDDFPRLAKRETARGYSQRSATLGSTAAAGRAGR